ncbi:hypothetical protein D3C87_98930 [compost metagenome]
MKFENNKKLNSKITHDILQDVYDAVPAMMKLLAPNGWEGSSFHQELMACRQLFYNDYRNEDTNQNNDQEGNSILSEYGPHPENEMSMEEYLYITFPPLHNDYLELYYILICILLEITFVSNLYQDHGSELFYLDEIDLEEMVIRIAHKNGQISEDWAEVMNFAFPPPYLDEMEVHYCLEVLFSILKRHGFKLDYYHNELLSIAELQRLHEDLLFRNLDVEEKEKQRQQVQTDILEILYEYDRTPIDPFDFRAIIDLFNRRAVCPLVLAYLHVYHEFPTGYPYRLTDYLF